MKGLLQKLVAVLIGMISIPIIFIRVVWWFSGEGEEDLKSWIGKGIND